jgi:hypothetical protein
MKCAEVCLLVMKCDEMCDLVMKCDEVCELMMKCACLTIIITTEASGTQHVTTGMCARSITDTTQLGRKMVCLVLQ